MLRDLIVTLQSKLENWQSGGKTDQWTAHCPAHDDKQNSLSIALNNKNGQDAIGLFCHAGCKFADIVAALGMKQSDFFEKDFSNYTKVCHPKPTNTDQQKTVKPIKEQIKYKTQVIYDYTDENGKLLFQCLRKIPENPEKDGTKKIFRQRRPDPEIQGKFIYNLEETPRVLFQLPQLIKDIKDNKTIFIVGGEKDVLNLRAIGIPATTNPLGEGPGKWLPSFNPYFKNSNVVIIPDNDETGYNHANEVYNNLKDLANVKILVLPSLELHEDVSDYLQKGGTLVKILKLADTTAISGNVQFNTNSDEEKSELKKNDTNQQSSVYQESGLSQKDNSKSETPTSNTESFVDDTKISPELKEIRKEIHHEFEKTDEAGNKTKERRLVHAYVVKALLNRYRICSTVIGDKRKLYMYQDGFWQLIPHDVIFNIISPWFPELTRSARTIDAIIQLLARTEGVYVPFENFNAKPHLINLSNGTYNLKTHLLEDHNPEHYFTYKNDYPFIKDAKCPEFSKGLMDYSMSDIDWISVFWEISGYALTGIFPFQKMFWFTGPGRNGKGTVIRVLEKLVGKDLTLSDFNLKSLGDRFYKKEIMNKRLVTTGELPVYLTEVSKLKQLTGGDTQHTDVKYGDAITFQSFAKFIFAMNKMPAIPETESVMPIARRIIILPFDFEIKEENTDVEDVYKSEISGIFNRAIEGLQNLLTRKQFTACQRSKRALEAYAGHGNMISSYVSERIKRDENSFLFYYDLEDDYYKYMERNCGVGWNQKSYYITNKFHLRRKILEDMKNIETGRRYSKESKGSESGFECIRLKSQLDILIEDFNMYGNRLLQIKKVNPNLILTLDNILTNIKECLLEIYSTDERKSYVSLMERITVAINNRTISKELSDPDELWSNFYKTFDDFFNKVRDIQFTKNNSF